MSYSVFIQPRARKKLADLPADVYPRMRDRLLALADDPRPPGVKKLVGRDGWRIRIGENRAIYEVDDAQRRVTILHIGPRSTAYR